MDDAHGQEKTFARYWRRTGRRRARWELFAVLTGCWRRNCINVAFR